MSLRCLNQISNKTDISKTSQKHLKRRLFCDLFKTSQIHLKKDEFFVISLRRIKYITKKMFSCDVFKASQTCLKKDVYSVTSLIRLKYICWKYLSLFKNIPQKWFCSDKIKMWTLQTLKKRNVVFWEQRIAINQSAMCISGLMFGCCLSQ